MNTNRSKAIQKYLLNYAAPTIDVSHFLKQSSVYYGNAIIVPVYEEGLFFPPFLMSLAQAVEFRSVKVLLVATLNRHSDSPLSVEQDNEKLLKDLLNELKEIRPLSGFARSFLGTYSKNLDIIILDATSPTTLLPHKKGVGLARKMAADLCLKLYCAGRISSPWLRSTDADVIVPKDYFHSAESLSTITSFTVGLGEKHVAFTYPYFHLSPQTSDGMQERAVKFYDTYLQSYPRSLRFSGSPYAFHALGSILIFHLEAYAQVRGFPERAAAEDFYLLNKMAKIGKISALSCQALQISGRVSLRTPLGTGRSILQISKNLDEQTHYSTYHPQAFRCLKTLIEEVVFLLQNKNALITNPISYICQRVVCNQPGTDEIIARFLQEIHFQFLWEKIHSGTLSPIQALKEFHSRFDGLKTQQFLKALCQQIWGFAPQDPNPQISP